MKYAILGLAAAAFVFAGCAALVGRDANSRFIAAQPVIAATPDQPAKTIREITYTDGEWDGKEVVHTEEEWRQMLTPDEYGVLRQAGTERAFTGELTNNHKKGTYYCAACGLAVFRSEAKFESGTGWPSFFKPLYKKNLIQKDDKSLSTEERTEILCARCHSHLGHVFDDGPQPTGLRYCMNSVALRFKADADQKRK